MSDNKDAERSHDVINEESFAELSTPDPGFELGELKLSESGLSLPIDVAAGGDEEPEALPTTITEEDLAALARVEAELDQRWSEIKIDPTLERIELLMDLLGNPERAFPSIHVAGTNGKTSTTATSTGASANAAYAIAVSTSNLLIFGPPFLADSASTIST